MNNALQRYLIENNAKNMTLQEISSLMAKKSISVKGTEGTPLLIFKYSDLGADFADPVVKCSRGIILDKSKDFEAVCVPFDKFGNYTESYADDIDWNSARVQEKLDGCFSRFDTVLLADGSKKPIGEIVNKKLKCEVLSYNFNTGKIEPKQVVGWKKHKELFNNKEWVTFYLKGAKQSINCAKQSQHNIMTVTKNHKIFVKNKKEIIEKYAGDITTNDILLSPVISLTKEEEQIIYGSLLGDSSLSYCKEETIYPGIRFCHSLKQIEYARMKKEGLRYLSPCEKIRTNCNNSYGKEKITIQTKNYAALSEVRNICYKNGKKYISEEWLNKLDWLGIAIWYMDDGNRVKSSKNNAICFGTEGYSYEENITIKKYFEEKWGFKVYLQFYKNKYYRITLSTKSSEYVWSHISQYFPPSMQYKLPERHREKYIPLEDNSEEKRELIFSEVKISKIEQGCNRVLPGGGTKKYDIEVADNHNYFCDGVLVHNSIIKLWYYENEHRWVFSTNGTIFADNAHLTENSTFGDLIRKASNYSELYNELDILDKDFTYMFELISPENRIVIGYPETKLVHIGTRNNKTGQEITEDIGIEKPTEYFVHTLDEAIKYANEICTPDERHEGFVVVDKNYHRIKVKNAFYLQAHYLMGKLNSAENIVKVIDAGDAGEILSYMPDVRGLKEFLEIFEEFKKDVSDYCRVTKETFFDNAPYPLTKELNKGYADVVLRGGQCPFPSIMFRFRDYYEKSERKGTVAEFLGTLTCMDSYKVWKNHYERALHHDDITKDGGYYKINEEKPQEIPNEPEDELDDR